MTAGYTGVELCDDLGPAQWLLRALRPWDGGISRVATLVPAAFPAHARILHRAGTHSDDMRWAEVAAATGRPLRATTQYAELVDWHDAAGAPSPPAPWREPERGSLRPEECTAVAQTLAEHTTTPDRGWFCVWEGYGTAWTTLNELARDAPRVPFEHRACLLFRGPVLAATSFREPPWFQSPTWWWPDDRAWCVATELDGYSTYVGAAAAAVDALAARAELEVVVASPDDDIDHGPYAAAHG